MTEHDELDVRLSRLRAETEQAALPAPIASRLEGAIQGQGRKWFWYGALVSSTRRALVVGALAAAVLAAGVWWMERRLRESRAAASVSAVDAWRTTP
jgi:hypothetical protein